MKVFVLMGLVVLLTACTGGSGFDRIRHVEESKLHGQHMSTVVELLGTPDAYYAAPDGQTEILAYDTIVRGASLTPAGCLFLIGLAGSGSGCPRGGEFVYQCVALRFGPDRRVIEVDRPQLFAEPCIEMSDERFLPATRRPVETIPQ